MKLYLNTASPYARLIRVLLIETGLESETTLELVDPWEASSELLAANPAGKIPALSLEDGTHLIESGCIAEYLILRAGMPALSPICHEDPPAQLELLGLGRAAIDCAFGAVIQQRFAQESPLIERWLGALPRIARRLDNLYGDRKPSPDCDLADLTVTVAFDYIQFRLPEVDWRSGTEHLANRVSVCSERSSLVMTRPE